MPLGYQLDKLKGRLVGCTSRLAYNPQAFNSVEPIPVLKSSVAEKPLSVRGISDLRHPLDIQQAIKQTEIHGKFPDNPRYRKLQEKQRIMTRQDGKFVWQKLPSDLPMYRATVALCGVGLLWMGSIFYKMAYPQKKD